MKIKLLLMSIFALFAGLLFSQIKPEILYDEETGDYIFKFQYEEGGYIHTVVFEPATKIDPYVNSNVSYDDSSKLYIYFFTIRNGVTSKQRLLSFELDYYSSIEKVSNPSFEWVSGSFAYRKTFSWAHVLASMLHPGKKNGIPPDSTVSGFQFYSPGLPAICTAYFQGETRTLLFPEEPPGEIEAFLDVHERFPANTVQRKTLGPKDPPSPFVPTAFLDTLVSYTRQSKNLGWITDQAVAEKYEGYFTMAQNMLQQNRITETRAKLQEVLQDVEADSGAFLTSEAYALLRYNTEYLLSQLPESEVTLEDLIAYIRKAQTERKIDNVGIANSLISKLEEAKKQLEKEKSKQTVNALNGFLNELSRQHQKHIADEVYGYLKEKVERLISQIESSG